MMGVQLRNYQEITKIFSDKNYHTLWHFLSVLHSALHEPEFCDKFQSKAVAQKMSIGQNFETC